jgi:ApbE superfamily uncharacterized protein (UPF0280 family)
MERSSDYGERFYRKWQKPEGLTPFRIQQGETDLQIYAASNLSERAFRLTAQYRGQIEETIGQYPAFKSSLKPLHLTSSFPIVTDMIRESNLADVGPMAGVAGAIAEYVGNGLLPFSDEIIVENGGDVFMRTRSERVLHVYAGEKSPFKDKVFLKLKAREYPYAVCTSSAHIGHSLSFGNTDATVVIAQSAIRADVFATAIGNRTKSEDDIDSGLAVARDCGLLLGALIVIDDRIGAWGDIEFAQAAKN